MSARTIEELRNENAELRLRNAQLETEYRGLLRLNGRLSQRIDTVEQLLKELSGRLAADLRAHKLAVPAEVSLGIPEQLIPRIDVMVRDLIGKKAAIFANNALESAEARVRAAAESARELQEALATERQNSERACHFAATLLTYFAGPTAPKDWYHPGALHELDFPTELRRLLDSAAMPAVRHRDLVEDGSLPSAGEIDLVFGSAADVDRVNKLQELIREGTSGVPREVTFVEANATTVIIRVDGQVGQDVLARDGALGRASQS